MNFLGRLTSSRVVRAVAKKLHFDAILPSTFRRWTTSVRVVTLHQMGLGYMMRLDPQELSDYEGEFERGERDFLEALKTHLHPGETVLDVGAHWGEFALPLAKLLGETGRVLAFEPDERAHLRLVDHIKLNSLSNIQTFKKGLGDEDGEAKIFFGGGNCPSIVPLENDETRRSASDKIEIVRGDTFFSHERLPIPHAVKIDVEGFEHAVLGGLCGTLASPTCRLVCVEVHPEALPPGVSTESITNLLRSCGFEEFEIEPRATEVHIVAIKPAPAA